MHMNVSVTMINNDAVSAMGSLMLMVHYLCFFFSFLLWHYGKHLHGDDNYCQIINLELYYYNKPVISMSH